MCPSWSSKMDDSASIYNGVIQPMRSMIDRAARATLMKKTKDKEYNLIKEMVLKD